MFNTQQEYDIYVTEQKVRMEKGYLTRSERDKLKQIIDNPKSYIIPKLKDKSSLSKEIITDISKLRNPSLAVEKNEDISQIIQTLKDTHKSKGGWGLSANQIGYNKRVSYLKVPTKINPKTKETAYTELVLINTKIIEQSNPIKIMNEGCLSFPGVAIITQRHVFLTIENYNQKLEIATMLLQDNEALCAAHEIDHQNGKTIFDRKWRSK
jgi:peptide deformylase